MYVIIFLFDTCCLYSKWVVSKKWPLTVQNQPLLILSVFLLYFCSFALAFFKHWLLAFRLLVNNAICPKGFKVMGLSLNCYVVFSKFIHII